MKTCKTCEHFERLNWHESMGGGEQLGGNCQLLLHVLNMDNPFLIYRDHIYVQDTFGCILHREPEVVEP